MFCFTVGVLIYTVRLSASNGDDVRNKRFQLRTRVILPLEVCSVSRLALVGRADDGRLLWLQLDIKLALIDRRANSRVRFGGIDVPVKAGIG